MSLAAFLLRRIGRVELAICCALVVGMVLTLAAQVVARYFLGSPIRWVEEFGVAAFVWVTFLSGSLAYKEGGHIRLWSPLYSSRGWLIHSLVGNLLIVATALVVLTVGPKVFAVENLTVTASLPITLPRGFVFSGALIAGFASILLSALFLSLRDVAALMGREQDDWTPSFRTAPAKEVL